MRGVFILALLIAAAAGAAAQESAPPDAATGARKFAFLKPQKLLSPAAFLAEPAYRSLSLSPSGRYLVAAREIPIDEAASTVEAAKAPRRDGPLVPDARGDQIVIFDLDGGEPADGFNMEGLSVRWVEWASEERLLVSLSIIYQLDYYGFRLLLPGSRLVSVDRRTKEVAMLFENKRAVVRDNISLSHVVNFLPDDPDHVLMPAYRGAHLDLWKVNVVTGAAERVETGNSETFRWVTDRHGTPVFRLDMNARGTVMRVFTKDADARWKKVTTAKLKENQDTPEFWPIAPGENDGEMYVRAFPKDEPRATIKTFNLATSDFGETILSHPEYDIANGLVDSGTGDYVGGFYIDDRYRFVFADKSLQQHMDAVNRFFADKANVFIQDISASRGRLLLYVSGPQIPGEYYVYDFDKRRIEPLFSARPELDESNLAAVEVVRYEARDGRRLTAYVTHPRAAENALAPFIVMPHGGPEHRDAFDYDPLAQFLASRGYRVLQPNFRGSSGYGRELAEAGYGEWGGKMQDDLTDAVRWLIGKGLAKEKWGCILGASYGGYAALYGAIADPDLYACAAAAGGVFDLPALLAYERRSGDMDGFDYAVQSIGDPERDRPELEARSPARRADALAIPVLIAHGELDSVVPIEQARSLMKALDKAGKPYEKFILDDEGHSFEKLSSKVQYMRKLEAFLAKHLLGPQ